MHGSSLGMFFSVVLGLLTGCTLASRPEPTGATVNPWASSPVGVAAAEPPKPGPTPPVAEPRPAPAASKAKAQLHFDLAAHAERAELHQGSTLVMDFGVPGDAKYTFGGWLSGAGRGQRIEDTTALLVPDKSLKLALPAQDAGAATLSMRVRGFAAGPLTVYVNNEVLADLKLGGKGFETFTLPIHAGLLAAGDNRLQLRVTRTGSAPSVANAGLALDFVRLGPAGAAPSDDAPPNLSTRTEGGSPNTLLRIPGGFSVSYTLEVPAGAVLRCGYHAASSARLAIVAARDGAPKQILAELSATPSAQTIDVDLGSLAGELVRIELSASSADVLLDAPRVVTFPREQATLAAAPKAVRNAIIVLVDTLRADKLSAYQPDTLVKTPGLGTFLQSAAVMLNARTQENWTKPSVATLLSSLLPWQHKAVTDEAVVPASVELLPELLHERGFYTGAFIANGYVSDKFGFKQGWSTYRNYIREGRPTVAQYVASDVLKWLDQRPKEKPFFLYVHAIDPHVPYIPPQHFLQMYDAAPYTGPVDFRKTNELLEKIKIGSLKLATRDKQHLEALYNGEISYQDVHFAAVMQGLVERGLADDTVVVFTSDHGEEFWDHGSVGHGHSVYDELLHVPLIVRLPGVTEGKQRLSTSVGLIDVMPTILDALGQPIPEELVGRSFLPDLRGEGETAPRAVASGFMTGWRTLGVGRYKLIHRTLEHAFLYDIQADPGEKHDLRAEQPIAFAHARGLLGMTLADDDGQSEAISRLRTHKSQSTAIDPATEAQLRALGYVGTSRKPK